MVHICGVLIIASHTHLSAPFHLHLRFIFSYNLTSRETFFIASLLLCGEPWLSPTGHSQFKLPWCTEIGSTVSDYKGGGNEGFRSFFSQQSKRNLN
jgi:hypothetical protein